MVPSAVAPLMTGSIVLRPVSTSELLDRTFFLYRNHFLVFAGIAAISELPVIALRVGNIALAFHGVPISRVTGTIVTLVGVFVTLSISQAATVIAVSDLHLERVCTIRGAYALARRAMIRVIWISFVVGIAIPCAIGFPVGFLLLMVLILVGLERVAGEAFLGPIGLIVIVAVATRVWLAWSLVVPVTVLEQTGLRASMRRSRFLTKGTLGRIFVICLLVVVLTWTVRVMFQLPVFAVERWTTIRSGRVANNGSLVFLAIGTSLGAILVGPLLTITLTLQYYDSRVRKEGFDLELMMSNLASASEPEPVSATVEMK